MKLESGESDLDSYAATVRTCWSVKACSGEPLASVVTKNKQESDIEHKRNGEGELSGAAAVGGLLYEDPNIPNNKTSKWIVSMKYQDGWWYIVCAFMTVLIGVIGILHFQRQKSNSSFINTNGIVLPRNFAIVMHKLQTLFLPFSNNNPVVDYSITVEFHI